MIIKNRAIEDWQKKDVMEKILKVWMDHPTLRLNQLIINALGSDEKSPFYIEDYDLVEKVIELSKRITK